MCVALTMDDKSIRYLHEDSNGSYLGIEFGQEYVENYLKTKVKAKYRTNIVGFSKSNIKTVFVFGKVKTSGDTCSPPGVICDNSGMVCQLENIKGSDEIKNSLIRWLAHKSNDKKDDHPLRKDFINACKTFFKSNKKKLKIVGVLIRDTGPNERDLESAYRRLVKDINPQIFLGLLAIYLSIKINSFEKIMQDEEN